MTLKEKRIKLNMTQIELAKAVGVSLTAYQMWEKEVSNPSEENSKKLQAILRNVGE